MLGLKKNYSSSWHLMALVLAAVLPFFVFSTLMVNRLVKNEQTASELRLLTSAQEMAFALDQEVETTTRTLQAIAVSESLNTQDLRLVYQDLRKILKTQPGWISISIQSPEGEKLLSTTEPSAMKAFNPIESGSLRQPLATGKASVGPIIALDADIRQLARFGFAVQVPILKDNRVQLVLSALIDASSLQHIVNRFSDSGKEWARALADANGRVAARSRSPELFVGKLGTIPFLQLIEQKDQGIAHLSSFEGEDVYLAFSRVPSSGWAAAISVSSEVFEAQANESLLLVITVGILLLLLFGGATLFYSRHLARSIQSAARGAEVLALGGIPLVENSRVLEVEQLRESLLRTAELLQSKEKERNAHLSMANAARAEAEEATRVKSQFLANMSHELRTPLGVVLGFSELYAKDMIQPEEREQTAEIIQRSGGQLLRLIDDILDLSKVEANKMTIEAIDFSLPDILSGLIADFKPQALEKGIELTVQSEGEIPEIIHSDPVRLRQILFNIVGNALKFSTDGKVDVTLKAKGEHLTFIVRDTGIGLTAEQQKYLFTSFSQADSSHTRKYGGTGLGLALSKKIAKLMGGDVQLLQSQKGIGSVFQIDVKVQITSKKPLPSPFMEAAQQAKVPLSGVRVLLTEDSPDNMMLIKTFLKNAGAIVELAEDGLEALEKVQTHSFDIILMDIQMPRMDGYQATQKLRAKGMTMPIIALTAHAQADHREKARQHGYTDYLTKPIRRDQLVTCIQKNLKKGPEQAKPHILAAHGSPYDLTQSP